MQAVHSSDAKELVMAKEGIFAAVHKAGIAACRFQWACLGGKEVRSCITIEFGLSIIDNVYCICARLTDCRCGIAFVTNAGRSIHIHAQSVQKDARRIACQALRHVWAITGLTDSCEPHYNSPGCSNASARAETHRYIMYMCRCHCTRHLSMS